MGDRLRAVWDFDDLDATENRFRTMLSVEPSPAGQGAVLTQLARIAGLRGDLATGADLLDEAEECCGGDPLVHARVALERGRLRRAAGDPGAALQMFETAFQSALAGGEDVLAVDAAHMAALLAADRPGRTEWTKRGMELAQRSGDPATAEWIAPLQTNLGWDYFRTGDYEPALDAFERALQQREREPSRPAEIELARFAVARTLRALGQPQEAAALLEQAVAWAEANAAPDPWYHEELAEAYAALGKDEQAREQALHALALLPGADPEFTMDGARAHRLRELVQ